MLSCIIGNKSINSFDYEECKLRDWSNKKILRCPECGERVIYCNGDYKIAYFKHETSSECKGNLYNEPTTEEHIGGIKVLYNKLKTIEGVENLEVEKYIINTKQRPDIYFEYKGQRYCIEYQCSPIATQYNKRHELYELEGIKDIWILGTSKYNFEKYEEFEKYILFNEKRLKTIEDEIDKGFMPLLYLSEQDGVLYKINQEGFKPILRNEWKEFKNNKPLKRVVKLILSKVEVNSIDIEVLCQKENMAMCEIDKAIKNTILKLETEFKTINDTYNTNYKFNYNLSVDRFPMYKYWLPTCGYRLIYDDIECKVAKNDLCELKVVKNMNETVESVNKNKIDNVVSKINKENINYVVEYIYAPKLNRSWNKRNVYMKVTRKSDGVKLIEKLEVDIQDENLDINEIYKYILNKISEDLMARNRYNKVISMISKITNNIDKGVSISNLKNSISIINDNNGSLCTYIHLENKYIRFIRYYKNEYGLNREEIIKKYTDEYFYNTFKNMIHNEIRRVRYGGTI